MHEQVFFGEFRERPYLFAAANRTREALGRSFEWQLHISI